MSVGEGGGGCCDEESCILYLKHLLISQTSLNISQEWGVGCVYMGGGGGRERLDEDCITDIYSSLTGLLVLRCTPKVSKE